MFPTFDERHNHTSLTNMNNNPTTNTNPIGFSSKLGITAFTSSIVVAGRSVVVNVPVLFRQPCELSHVGLGLGIASPIAVGLLDPELHYLPCHHLILLTFPKLNLSTLLSVVDCCLSYPFELR